MITTSQNRVAVIQANAVNVRGQVLAAAVVHQHSTSMRPYLTRRTRLPFATEPTFSKSKRRLDEARLHQPDGCGAGLGLPPRLWARLVLSKMSRG
jgi:hypothetical protein